MAFILLIFRELFGSLYERIRSIGFRKKHEPAKRGNGQPVLVIPGFMASDLTMKPMRRFLKRIGYTPYKWECGRNLARVENLDFLEEKVKELYEQHGKKVSIIGWSLGGIYARELSKRQPNLVRQVISMSSPFGGIDKSDFVLRFFKIIKRKDLREMLDEKWLKTLPEPTPVFTTAIYSKKDKVIGWQYCIDKKEDALHKNIEAYCTHMGMPYDKTAFVIIAERLAMEPE